MPVPTADNPSPGRRLLRGARKQWISLTLAAAAIVLAICYPGLVPYAIAGAILVSLVFAAHESAHYLTAKRAGLGIREVSIGFGPRLISGTRNGVAWSVKALLIGGAVDIEGMTSTAVEEHHIPRERAFVYSPVRTRLIVSLSGIGVNLILGWAAATTIVISQLDRVTPTRLLLAPVAGIVLVAQFLLRTAHSIWLFVSAGTGSAGTILSLPANLHTGAQTVIADGVSLVLYGCLLVFTINVTLALVNVLPLYPLDGYHATVAAIDGLRSLRARRLGRIIEPLNRAQLRIYDNVSGYAFTVLVVFAFGRDLMRFAGL